MNPFTGCGTALVTPFQPDGSLDEPALRRLVARQLEARMHFLVPCGTTGEAATLSRREQLRVVEVVLDEAKGHCPVLAGCGGNATAEVVAHARDLQALGADGLLVVTPYYNKPTQEGLYCHFEAIARAAELPIVLYNVPGRTGVHLDLATVARLAALETVVALKEASGNLSHLAGLCANLPRSFGILAGDDVAALPLAALGGCGVISVASNEIPSPMRTLAQACLDGDFSLARQIASRYLALFEANFLESNPLPVKAALARMGLLEPVWRLPLVAPQRSTLTRLEEVLSGLGLLR